MYKAKKQEHVTVIQDNTYINVQYDFKIINCKVKNSVKSHTAQESFMCN